MPATFTVDRAEYDERNTGRCVACGAEAYGVEPDASGYECEECGQPSVYGLEELLMLGRLTVEGES